MRLIDADALKEDFEYAVFDDVGTSDYEKMLEIIDSQPTLERPHGKWKITDNRWGVGTWLCTRCESYYDIDTNFCPNCGADMRKKVKRNEID